MQSNTSFTYLHIFLVQDMIDPLNVKASLLFPFLAILHDNILLTSYQNQALLLPIKVVIAMNC